MRISGRETDVDFWRNHFRDAPKVLLNGAEVDHVVEANTDHGYVVRTLYDDAGKLKLAEMRTEDGEVIDIVIAEKTFRGVVTIEGERI